MSIKIKKLPLNPSVVTKNITIRAIDTGNSIKMLTDVSRVVEKPGILIVIVNLK